MFPSCRLSPGSPQLAALTELAWHRARRPGRCCGPTYCPGPSALPLTAPPAGLPHTGGQREGDKRVFIPNLPAADFDSSQ